MRITQQLAPTRWLRLPRRTARLRLTALYGGLFLLLGAALVAVTYVLYERATAFSRPQLPKVPHAPNIQSLKLVPSYAIKSPTPLGQSLPDQLQTVQQQLVVDQHQFAAGVSSPLATQNQQLTQDQHQLAQATNHLAQAVHALAQSSTAQAAQRAADSHQLLVNSGIALAIVALLALLAGWLVAGRMLRPIRTITRTARRISSTSLHERLALTGPEDELKELGDTLDDLFGRLDAAFEAQRRFVANASHELRTPLTAERTLLQVALDDPATTVADWQTTAREVLASSDEQARLIDALLTLASSESGLNGRETVDLAAVVAAALVDSRPEIEQRVIHVEGVTTPAPLEGDPLLVERLVANLLTNAIRHNDVDGRVEVVTGVKDGKAVLTVTNTGPRIPPAQLERLFQPFQRLDARRAHYKDGHGLGLSIVRAIASAHGATIAARPLADGGLSVSVIFPRPAYPDRLTRSSPQQHGRGNAMAVAASPAFPSVGASA